MHTTDFWNKLNLHREKVVLCLLFSILALSPLKAQQSREINLPNYDRKWLHYGFSIGAHISGHKLTYDESFFTVVANNKVPTANGDSTSLHSIMPRYYPGFSLGLIANLKLGEFFDLRFVPQVGFYDYWLQYNYANGAKDEQILSVTMVDFPILLKYKSQRRKNMRMYFLAGVSPSIEASGKKNDESTEKKLFVNPNNLSVQFGVGLDNYFKLFKFSPEIRFSKGLANVLREKEGSAGEGVKRLTTNVVTFYLLFE